MIFGQGDFEQDMEDVVDLCSKWWDESLFCQTYGVPYRVHKYFFRAVRQSGALIYTIGRDDSGIAKACYVGIKMPYMFNPAILSASEIVWCVDRGVRSFQVLKNLLKEIDILMVEHNVKLWGLAVSNSPQFNALDRVLQRSGYTFMDRMHTRFRR